MIGQALVVKADVELERGSTNSFGNLVWQLGEVWPTGGWGLVEYGPSQRAPGQVIGGRWKPLMHWLRSHLFVDVFASCGARRLCVVKNDAPRPFSGTVVVTAVHFASGPSVVRPLALVWRCCVCVCVCVEGAGSDERRAVAVESFSLP